MITITCDCCKQVIRPGDKNWADITLKVDDIKIPYELCYSCFTKMKDWLEKNCDN